MKEKRQNKRTEAIYTVYTASTGTKPLSAYLKELRGEEKIQKKEYYLDLP